METQEVNNKEFQQLAFQTALAKSIISSQFALHNNEILKHTSYFKADVKKYGKPFILALIRAELKEFDKVDAKNDRFKYWTMRCEICKLELYGSSQVSLNKTFNWHAINKHPDAQ